MVPPCQFHPSAQNGRFGTGLGFCEHPHKRACFLRPPATTSPPRMTKRDRERGPTSSGQVRSFRRRAACNATPSMWAAPGRAAPSQWSGLTNVASMANCMPPNSGRPSATTSNRRRVLVVPTRPSWTHGRHLHDKLQQLHSPQQTPASPTTQTAHTLHDDSQVGGHIGWCEQWEGEEDACGTERPGTNQGQCARENSKVWLTRHLSGPLCDRKRALGIIAKSLKLRSTLEAASCCHPVRHEPRSNSSGGGGRAPCKTACHEGGSKPITPDNSSRTVCAATNDGGPTPCVRHSRNVSATDHCPQPPLPPSTKTP